jgi:ribosome maturation protein SDO1
MQKCMSIYMLLREVKRRLEDVSIVTLKAYGRKYELAVYPDELRKYRNGDEHLLESVLCSVQIYKDMELGEVASNDDVGLFGASRIEVIQQILRSGNERKPLGIVKDEISSVEKRIIRMVQEKVVYEGHSVSEEVLERMIKRVWNIRNEDPRRQVGSIIKRLEELGFERIELMVRCSVPVEYEGIRKEGGGLFIKSDLLPRFLEYCETEGIECVVVGPREILEEEIC